MNRWNMDDEDGSHSCMGRVFVSFVIVTLTLILGLNLYVYVWSHPLTGSLDGDFSNIKHIVIQLTTGLYEVNRKHERLQSEMERITAALPAMAAAANRAKDILEPRIIDESHHSLIDARDYDQQVADYALESAGGRIVDTGDTVEHVLVESPVGWALYMLSAWMCRSCHGARTILQPATLPGECWAFRGSKGEATIRLLGAVIISGVSLEHIPPQISPTREISSAPRLFQIEGLESRYDPYPYDYGTYEYDKDGKQIQYFEVKNPTTKGYNLIRFKTLSNWGHAVYTCVYRLRVHGELAPGQGIPKGYSEGDATSRIDNMGRKNIEEK